MGNSKKRIPKKIGKKFEQIEGEKQDETGR